MIIRRVVTTLRAFNKQPPRDRDLVIGLVAVACAAALVLIPAAFLLLPDVGSFFQALEKQR